jgi:hypothetical protein
MSTEAMKMALEALEGADSVIWSMRGVTPDDISEAIESLRQAIEQAKKQEPKFWEMPDGKIVDKWGFQFYRNDIGTPLYTNPKEWQDLTLEEIWDSTHGLTRIQKDDWVATDADLCEFAHIIEAKLRSKNK